MSTLIKGADVRTIRGGIRVKKSIVGTTAATKPIFTIAGLVVVRAILGHVTVAGDGTTTSLNLVMTPTVGGSAVDICAATVVTSDPIGTPYGFLGAAITTLLVSSGTSAPGLAYAPLQTQEMMYEPGVIGHKGTAADALSVDWYCIYYPLSDDGSVVAA